MVNNLGIFWFRQDLRLQNNEALHRLIKKCDKILPIFIDDKNVELGGASKWWLHHSLESLDKSLKKKNSKLYLFRGEPIKILYKLIKEYKIESVYWNRLYDSYSINRDINLKKILSENDVETISFKGSLINEPWSIKNKSNTFFKVFTPYWNACLEEKKTIILNDSVNKISTIKINSPESLCIDELKLYPKKSKWTKTLSLNWIPGEKQALKNLEYFKKNILNDYENGRDRPDKNITSKLSPHLHFGEISPEKIFIEIQNEKIINDKIKKNF